MAVLGLDPGTAITGFGLITENTDGSLQAVDFGVIQTPAHLPQAERLLLLYNDLKKLLLFHRPQSAAVEKLFFQRNVSTAIAVGQARGVILLALAEQNIPIGEYNPMEVKQAATGYGKADKRQVQEMVRTLLRLESIPKPDDAADALAIAICHLYSHRFNQFYQ